MAVFSGWDGVAAGQDIGIPELTVSIPQIITYKQLKGFIGADAVALMYPTSPPPA